MQKSHKGCYDYLRLLHSHFSKTKKGLKWGVPQLQADSLRVTNYYFAGTAV